MAERSERAHAVLTARRDAGAGMRLVTITPPHDLVHRYRAPGQYVQVHAESAGYFVLAGEVDAPSWELLVRNNGDASAVLTEAPEGTTVEVSGPLGNGFPLERARGRPLVVVVAGSALAVARPILRERIAFDETVATSIFIGVRSPRDVPLASEVAGWARAGARLVLCLSREADDAEILPTAERRSGWTQHVLAAELRDGHVPEGAIVFAAGPAGMLADVRDLGLAAVALEVVTNV